MNLSILIDRWKYIFNHWWRKHTVKGLTVDAKIASIIFSGQQGDYYLFLADTIKGTRGRKSLTSIFISDIERYGNSARGKLSAHWNKQYKTGGGSLHKTFGGTLPADDVSVLDTLLNTGGERALENALRDLAENSQLLAKARGIVLAATLGSFVCLSITAGMFIAMPMFTVPKIVDSFSMLPLSEYPESAMSLVNLSEFVNGYWPIIVLGLLLFIALVVWSLSYVTGNFRRFLDKYLFVWGLHRDFQSIKFLSTLAALVRQSDKNAVNLKLALEMQVAGASRWKKYHLSKILDFVTRGKVGPEIFTTGIMDQTMEWYIADLIQARGFSDALLFVKERLKDRVLKRITVQSLIFGWVLILTSIAVAAWLLMWHMTALDDMRQAVWLYLSK
ncbi:MAG: hypothetical protein WC749_01030 [Dehalococcoidia bacterium]|uniref:hypothetical protein n=1 Tax=unclassified Pseudomonas TaxID=196821 RepID=UPI0014757025|nr:MULTISPECIES: hypothetical protein [unclassified Pseudomonas]NMX92481.1 hypothetical protein [Pseudomonas sp. WS 5086]NMY47241.1 hypothetical protein [Pseudomonas sp. WS 5027]